MFEQIFKYNNKNTSIKLITSWFYFSFKIYVPITFWAFIIFFLAVPVATSASILKDIFGFSVSREANVPPDYAESLIQEIFPPAEWEREGLPLDKSQKGRSYIVDHGPKGQMVIVFRQMTSNYFGHRFKLLIERPSVMPLRHKIVVGTDKGDWEILRRAPVSPKGAPFQRTYLLRAVPGGILVGMAFYEGAFASIEWNARSNNAVVKAMERLTWRLAARLRAAYAKRIAEIANKMEDNSPVPTRPDLPDPDP